jgi:hypothetical protein
MLPWYQDRLEVRWLRFLFWLCLCIAGVVGFAAGYFVAQF